jgi:uncharacterized phage-associated protein
MRAVPGLSMRISREHEKLAEAVIFFVTNTKHCGLTKLLKLLFFFDFTHYRQTGQSVTGLEYRAWPKGPAPSDVWHDLALGKPTILGDAVAVSHIVSNESSNKFTKLTPKRAFDEKYFSKRELKIMQDLAEVYRDATADMIVEVSHLKNGPWDRTLKAKGPSAVIDYELALDGSTPLELPGKEIEARLLEQKEDLLEQ